MKIAVLSCGLDIWAITDVRRRKTETAEILYSNYTSRAKES
jgi:hypothetical protein